MCSSTSEGSYLKQPPLYAGAGVHGQPPQGVEAEEAEEEKRKDT